MNQNSKFSVRDICYAGLFAAVIAVMAQISIPMPLGVPMTMQTFAITLAAVVLGSKLSAIATLVYLMRALWMRAMCLTMARPRPVPPVALLRLLSTR